MCQDQREAVDKILFPCPGRPTQAWSWVGGCAQVEPLVFPSLHNFLGCTGCGGSCQAYLPKPSSRNFYQLPTRTWWGSLKPKSRLCKGGKNRDASSEALLAFSLMVWEEHRAPKGTHNARLSSLSPPSAPATDSEHALKHTTIGSLPARPLAQREPVGLTMGVKPEWRPRPMKRTAPFPVLAGGMYGPVVTKFGATQIFFHPL